MSKKYDFVPDYAVVPGESLREAIEYLGMSQVDFAQRMGLSEQSLVRILKGEQPVTHETANKLDLVTGISCEFWNNLEARYQEQLQRLKYQEHREEYKNWLKLIPLKELVKRNFITLQQDVVEQAMEVLRFYQTSSMDTFKKYVEGFEALARGSVAFKTSPINATTYVCMGLREAQEITVKPFDKEVLRNVLNQVRAMTKDLSQDFSRKLQELLASAGVALVFVPPLKGVHFSGVSKWLSPTKAMIIMNIRGKAEDRFWFSLFHEAGHILKHSKKQMFISDSSPDNVEEREADKFAADYLIPEEYNDRIKLAVSEEELIRIAEELDISVGIVVGRYQHLTQEWHKYKNQIRKLEWK